MSVRTSRGNDIKGDGMENFIRLVVSEEISNQILEARKQGNFAGKPYQFMKHLVLLGLSEYRAQIERETPPTAALEGPPHIEAKIIPFPGVSLSQGDDFQDTLDGFLREMGYIEKGGE